MTDLLVVGQRHGSRPRPILENVEKPLDELWGAQVWVVDADPGDENGPRKAAKVAENVAVEAVTLSPQFDRTKGHSELLHVRDQLRDEHRGPGSKVYSGPANHS